MEFLNFQKSNSVGGKFLKIPSFINFPCGHVRSHPKFGTDWFSRFDVHWIQTEKKTERQTKYIFIIKNGVLYLLILQLKDVCSCILLESLLVYFVLALSGQENILI